MPGYPGEIDWEIPIRTWSTITVSDLVWAWAPLIDLSIKKVVDTGWAVH